MSFYDHFKFNNCHGLFAIEIPNADAKIHAFLKSVVCNDWINDPDYKAKQQIHPFVQGGYADKEGWIMIEFWCRDIDKVFAYLDYLNQRTHTFEFWE